jgi:hypothetical protein
MLSLPTKISKKEQLHDAMVNFQYLEFMLRGAIEKYEQLIRDRVKDYFEYPYDQKKIDNMTLGKLAEQYSKYTKNGAFKARVDTVIAARNKLAHAMFVKAEYLCDELGDELSSQIEDIYKASRVASDLGDMVVEQTQHINFDLYEEKWIKS